MFPKYEYRDHPIHVSSRAHQGSYPGRFHKHLEVMLVESAQVNATIDGVNYVLQPGDLYIAFPNVLHAVEAVDAQVLVMIVDFERYKTYQDVLLHHKPKVPVLRAEEFPGIVSQLLTRMAQLGQEQRQEILAGYANALLGELLNCLSLIPRSTDSTLVQKLVFYILKNYTRSINLDDIAQALGYSKFHLSREIKTLFGCNLRSLINSYRLSMAQNLLLSTDLPVGRIAGECGFRNQSAFNRIFLEQIGSSPSEYRKSAQHVPEPPAVYLK